MIFNLFYQPTDSGLIKSDVFDDVGELPSTARSFSRVVEQKRNPNSDVESMFLFRSPVDVLAPGDATVISDLEWDVVFAVKDMMFDSQHNTVNITNEALETKMYNLHERIVKACIRPRDYDYEGLAVSEKFSFKIHRPDTETFLEFHIWTRGETFINEYPDTDLYVIPPVPVIDDLWAGHDQVAVMLLGIPKLYLVDAINALTTTYPSTSVQSLTLQYHPDQCQSAIDTEWHFVVYGKEPNQEEKTNAIIEYLRLNSDHPISEWADRIFPDLYIRNEFIIEPNWNGIAVSNNDSFDELYSPFTSWSNSISSMFTAHGAYSEEFIRGRCQSLVFAYKWIPLMTCGSPTNMEGHERLSDFFPDYVPAKSSTHDYSRMSNKTIMWETFMQGLLLAADTSTNHLLQHDGIHHEFINNQKWAVATHEGVRYVMLMRSQ